MFSRVESRLAVSVSILWTSLLSLALGQTGVPAPAPTPPPTFFYASSITSGPDGNLWFTANRLPDDVFINRLDATHSVTRFSVPTAKSGPDRITMNPDGNLWFTEKLGNKIGRITPEGSITEFAVPTVDSLPQGIASGTDSNLWFVEFYGGKVGRLTPAGSFTEFPLPTADRGPYAITAGSDGALWFTESGANQIGRITLAGQITEFPLPPTFTGHGPAGITAGPDGNLWYAHADGRIGRISTIGSITEIPIPSGPPGSAPHDIAVGPDGNLWFTDPLGSRIGKATVDGVITMYPLPSPDTPLAIAAGPDGAMWFTRVSGNHVGRIALDGAFSCFDTDTTLCLKGGRFRVQAHWRKGGDEGDARAVSLTDEAGYFWFFEGGNIEVVAKVLNACGDPFDSYWFFAAGLTNVEVSMTVTDTKTGVSKPYFSPLGDPFQPILDTAAFHTCP